jgi:hypothetical protein
MDAFNKIVAVPSWAYDLCYYYLAVALIIVAYTLYALFRLVMLPGVVKKFVPVITLSIGLILSGGVAAVLTMMQFWICRSALSPAQVREKFTNHNGGNGQQKKSNGGSEQFAVQCASDADCLAVNGTQSGSLGRCQGGTCGGYTFNNHMETPQQVTANIAAEPQPSFSMEFGSGFAPY